MYLLYLDESGNEDNPDDRHFVLAGAGLLERQPHWLTERMNKIQRQHLPGKPPVPFHATKIRTAKGIWRTVDASVRTRVLDEVSEAICLAPPQHLYLFGAVVEKTDTVYGGEAVRVATQEVLKRFDSFLVREYREHGNRHRGLLIFSEGRFDRRVKVWVNEFREFGTEYGLLHNLSDIPFFASMNESRVLQAADLVAHALYLLYERRDASLIKKFLHRFAQEEGGRLLGIAHHHPGDSKTCECPACVSYERPSEKSPWLDDV